MIHHIVSSVNMEMGSGSTLGQMHRSDFSMDVHLLFSVESSLPLELLDDE